VRTTAATRAYAHIRAQCERGLRARGSSQRTEAFHIWSHKENYDTYYLKNKLKSP